MRKISEPFNITTKDGLVFGFYNPDGSVKILKNSYFRNFETNTLLPVYRNKRAELKSTGYVTGERFIRDFTFKNACEAYCCCYGRQDNGIAKFYTIDNIELNVYLESLLELKISSDSIDDISEKKISIREQFTRNYSIAEQVLEHANYKCELGESHKTFITKNGVPYMEAHHLIPLSKQDEFVNNLDVKENIICLCPTCHRLLHYGKDNKEKIEYLYLKRNKLFEQVGIRISFDKLYSYYD